MSLIPPGNGILEVEVTHISKHGFWLLLLERELFLPFSEFPWFREAAISAILNVQWLQPHHLYWPDLDVDLEVEAIEHPDRYPLIAQSGIMTEFSSILPTSVAF